MRTSMLVCLGTLLYMRLGAVLDTGHADPTRVLGQVVTGIGFLGAGVIMTRGNQVLGIGGVHADHREETPPPERAMR